jgi:hypothetical protein
VLLAAVVVALLLVASVTAAPLDPPASRCKTRGGRFVASEDDPDVDECDPPELGNVSQYWLIALAAGAPAQPVAAEADDVDRARVTGSIRTTSLKKNLTPARP